MLGTRSFDVYLLIRALMSQNLRKSHWKHEMPDVHCRVQRTLNSSIDLPVVLVHSVTLARVSALPAISENSRPFLARSAEMNLLFVVFDGVTWFDVFLC